MEFQKERVFTALNADELKIGSKVFVADNLATLKEYVDSERSMATIKHVANDSQEHRFIVQFDSDPNTCAWGFVYLVSEPENWIVYLCRGPSNPEAYYLTACRSDCWEVVQRDYGAKTRLFEGTEDEVNEWYVSRRHLVNVIAAWEDGKTIQYNAGDGWKDCCGNKPKWRLDAQYRIKPEGLKWTDLKIGDVIQNESSTHSMMVIGIDYREESKSHILIGEAWLDNDDLNYWKKVE